MTTRVADARTEIPRLVARLEAAGAIEVRKSMTKALSAAVIPVQTAIMQEAGMDFPKRGGLNRIMQRIRPRRVVKTSGRNVWIQVRYTGPAKYGDSGPWLHPQFGRNRTPKPNPSWRETSFPDRKSVV